MLDAGVLKEFDEPYNLLRCKGSILYNLVSQTGHDEAQRLFEMTVLAHTSRCSKLDEELGCLGDCHGGCPCLRAGRCGEVEASTVGIVIDTVAADDAPVHVHFNLADEQADEELDEEPKVVQADDSEETETKQDGVDDSESDDAPSVPSVHFSPVEEQADQEPEIVRIDDPEEPATKQGVADQESVDVPDETNTTDESEI